MKMFKNLFSRKNNNGIENSQQLLDLLGNWYDTEAGVTITPANAMQIAAVYSCIKVLAEGVGTLPLKLFKQTSNSKEVAKNNLNSLLRDGPNDFQTSQEFKELITAHLCLRGNHYSFINWANNEPVELLPLSPDAVAVKRNSSWELEYTITFPNGIVETLPAWKIFHVKSFSLDGITGINPIQQCRNTLGLAKATEKHGSKLFANGAHPGGGFVSESTLTDDQYKRLKNQLEDYKGDGAHKNLILEGGMKWFTVALNSSDAQFLETRQYQRSEIAGIFRVPPHMIADMEKATFSNIEHQGLQFVQHSLMPYLIRIESRINKSLLSKKKRQNYFAKFNTNALLRGDLKSRAEYYTKMIQNGALSPNEIRQLEDLNPRDGGDIYLTPMNMAINGKLPETSNDN